MKNLIKTALLTLVATVATFAQYDIPELGVDYVITSTEKEPCVAHIKTALALQNLASLNDPDIECYDATKFVLDNDIIVSPEEQNETSCDEGYTNWNSENATLLEGQVFDGNGHTISGICVYQNHDDPAFLMSPKTSSSMAITNVNFSNIVIRNTGRASLFANDASYPAFAFNITNVNVEDVLIISASRGALFFAELNSEKSDLHINIDNVKASNTNITAYNLDPILTRYCAIGGFIGALSTENDFKSNIRITNSTFNGNITVKNASEGSIGGFIAVNTSPGTQFIFNSKFNGNISLEKSVAATHDIGGLIGKTIAASSIQSSSFTGKISLEFNSWAKQCNITMGGLIGYTDKETSIENSHFQGSIVGTEEENPLLGNFYAGGLIGALKYNSLFITNSFAVPANKLSTAPLIDVTTYVQQLYLGGLVASAYDNQSVYLRRNSYAKGEISAKGNNEDLIGGGLIGELGAHKGGISHSYFIGSLLKNDETNGDFFVLHQDNENIEAYNSYGIDLNGQAQENTYKNYEYIAFGSATTADIYAMGNKIGSAKPNSKDFAGLLRHYKYSATENEGYPVPEGFYNTEYLWVKDKEIINEAYVDQNKKVHLGDGTLINERLLAKLPRQLEPVIDKGILTLDYWADHNANYIWSSYTFEENKEKTTDLCDRTIAFEEGSLTMEEPRFYKIEVDEKPIEPSEKDILLGSIYDLNAALPLYITLNEYNSYDIGDTWFLRTSVDEALESLPIPLNTNYNLYKSLIKTQKKANKSFTAKLVPNVRPMGTVPTEIAYTEISASKIFVNLDIYDTTIVFSLPPITKEPENRIVVPPTKKFFFNNSEDIRLAIHSGGDYNQIRLVKANDTVVFEPADPFSAVQISLWENAEYPIIVDTTELKGKGPTFITGNFPEKYFKTNDIYLLELPVIASVGLCVQGWKISYDMDGVTETEYSMSNCYNILGGDPLPECWEVRAVTGPVTISPNITEATNCQSVVQFARCDNEECADLTTNDPKDITWNVSLGSYNFDITTNQDAAITASYPQVTLPSNNQLKYNVTATETSGQKFNLILKEIRGGYIYSTPIVESQLNIPPVVDENPTYFVVAAFGSDFFEEQGVYSTWEDKEHNEIFKIWFNRENPEDYDLYNATDVVVSRNMENMPNSYVVEDGNIDVFYDNEYRVISLPREKAADIINYEHNYKFIQTPWATSYEFLLVDDRGAFDVSNEPGMFLEEFNLKASDVKEEKNLPRYSFKDENGMYVVSNSWRTMDERSLYNYYSAQKTVKDFMERQEELMMPNEYDDTNFPEGNKITFIYNTTTSEDYNILYGPINERYTIPTATINDFTPYNVTFEANDEEIAFSGFVFGKPYEFSINGSENTPVIDSIVFKGSAKDSIIAIQYNEQNNQVDYTIIGAGKTYKPAAQNGSLIKLFDYATHSYALNTEFETEGFVFKEFAIPTKYGILQTVTLPNLGSLEACFDGYSQKDQDADFETARDGSTIWYSKEQDKGTTLTALFSTRECIIDTNVITIDADTSATIDLVHFGDTLKSVLLKDSSRVFYLPGNGKWPVSVYATTDNDSIALDSIWWNGKRIKNGDTLTIGETGTIKAFITLPDSLEADTLDTDTLDVDSIEKFQIAETRILLSGNAMRLIVKADSFENIKHNIALYARLYVADTLFVDSLVTDSAYAGTFTYDHYPLDAGSYKVEAALLGETDTVTAFVDSFEISAVANSIKPGKWQMISLAAANEDFEIPNQEQGNILYWDEENPIGIYMQYQKLTSIEDIQPKTGYWISTKEPLDIELHETPKPENNEITWKLKNAFSGWNLIANPYSWDIAINRNGFVDPEDDSDAFWRWNQETMDYDIADTIKAFEALWIHTDESRDYTVDTRPAFPSFDTLPAEHDIKKKEASRNSWGLRLKLSGEDGSNDTWNVVGVGSRNINIDEPPTSMQEGVSLSIAEGNRNLAKYIKQKQNNVSWNLMLKAGTMQKGKLSVEGIQELENLGLYASLTVDGKTTPLRSDESTEIELSSLAKKATLNVSTTPAIATRGIQNLRFNIASSQLFVTFTLDNAIGMADIRLLDALGNTTSLVREKAVSGENRFTLSIPNNSGIYFLKVTANGTTKNVKIKF